MRTRPALTFLLTLLLAVIICPGTSWGHREDYIDETLVYLTLGRHEFEPEYWFDYGRQRDMHTDFMRHHVATEFGITEHWMVDGRATMFKPDDNGLHFDSARFETRYRFADEGTYPVDIAVSAEMNMERDDNGDDRYGIEPRLILSRDFGELNLTLNLSEEFPINSGAPEFLIASGFRYDVTQLFRFGSEFKYSPQQHEAAVIPQVWFAFPHDITLKFGYSHGFDRDREDFFRCTLELGF